MQVILLEDVKNVGKKDDIVNVSSGYANNFLIKKGLAAEATKKNVNAIKQQQAAAKANAAKELAEARELAKDLKDKSFTVKMKAGENGRLYGSLTNQDVAATLQDAGYSIDKRNISLGTDLKNIGTTTAELKLHNEVSVNIKVKVEEL